jgi:mono/diheme cytochrome c family protein
MRVLRLTCGLAGLSFLAVARLAAQAPDGQAIYREQCRTCHGAAGKPTQRAVSQYKNMPAFDAPFLASRSQDSIVAVLNHGAGKDMKSFKDKLSAEEIAAVARYVKETFGTGAASSH